MNVEPDQPTQLHGPSASSEGNLAVAQERIRELEDALCDCEQELTAANEIIDEQDWKIEELKVQLDGADFMLEDAAEARRKLERCLAAAEQGQAAAMDDLNACQIIDFVQKNRVPAPLPPEGSQHVARPNRRRNLVVEAMVAKYATREKK
jgi:chromosome segregation ATPase